VWCDAREEVEVERERRREGGGRKVEEGISWSDEERVYTLGVWSEGKSMEGKDERASTSVGYWISRLGI
jgi:hypothetical protein